MTSIGTPRTCTENVSPLLKYSLFNNKSQICKACILNMSSNKWKQEDEQTPFI